MERRAAGLPPASPVENNQLRARVTDLEQQVARAEVVQERKRLSPNELKARLDELFDRYGVEPAEELIQLATGLNAEGAPLLNVQDRIRVWTELLQYRMPKLRSMELSGKVDTDLTLKIVRFSDGAVLETRKIGSGGS